MIIIEGCDGAGKSTLVTRLGLPVHPKIPIEEPLDIRAKVYGALADSVYGKIEPRAYDRLFFSELVYGDIIRHRTVFNRVEVDYIFRMLKTLQCPIIFCTAPNHVIKTNVEESRQMTGVRENLQSIIEYYRWLISECQRRKLNVMTYEYLELDGYKYIQGRIEAYLEYRRQRSW